MYKMTTAGLVLVLSGAVVTALGPAELLGQWALQAVEGGGKAIAEGGQLKCAICKDMSSVSTASTRRYLSLIHI